jgi:response regulator RpfG family c-di-GMP phosphodiesterase
MLTANTTSRTGYKPLPLAAMVPEALPPVDLYLPGDKPAQVRLYRSADLPIQEEDIETLRERGVTELLVGPEDYCKIAEFMSANLSKLLADESQPPIERICLLNQVISDTLRDTLSASNVTETVAKTRALAEQVVETSIRSDVSVREVAQLARHDFCTFTHSANVSCYSVLLAYAAGIRKPEELREIAAGGMVHDIGKLQIPTQILGKPGRLTEQEFSVIRLHPTRGFQILRREPTVTEGQLMMTYQHHEWMNGNGYPVGCLGYELHMWSRICAIVDVFEALTAKRPYRKPNSIGEALAIMDRDGDSHFDAELFRCWKSHFIKQIES